MSAVVAPVIILGAPRSGTTMLASLFEQHHDTVVLREPRLVWRYGNDWRSDELRISQARPDVIAHIHRTFGADLDRAGKPKLVEKTPSNAIRPGFVDAVFPDAKFIHIIRNGWSAVPAIRDHWYRRAQGFGTRDRARLRRRLAEANLRQMPAYAREFMRRFTGRFSRHEALSGPRLAGIQEMADELGVLETAAHQWRSCVMQSASFGRTLPADRYVELRLESLTPDGIAGLFDFAGLESS